MSFVTYVLESESTGQFYIGQTQDLRKRIERHNSNGVKSTKNRGHWKLIFARKFETRAEAMHYERKLKSFKNRKYLIEFVRKQTA